MVVYDEHAHAKKILTTNSPDLTSVVPLHTIKKLIREPDRTHVYSVLPNRLSRDEERRVTFHVRLHRLMRFLPEHGY